MILSVGRMPVAVVPGKVILIVVVVSVHEGKPLLLHQNPPLHQKAAVIKANHVMVLAVAEI
ncbi:hypothetical protein CO054_00215 [Candidatus Shapirobacteria bacterium CG_4_9_14_0_2_um_filter_39_11]|uniref:Uncharacterized protein n=1 Tax=Candidatus Shapirobacteria bacterium CG_4_9_14_0_2_um_filter_39_11 TaxID=1974478 RepID=A0A2M8ETI0_9BACT|nr:MAG: hypothetical protein CO054_00215 [Candidatus Shapirobacteria bacterium CG_4_9_14_0_2_um_filter_39_11]